MTKSLDLVNRLLEENAAQRLEIQRLTDLLLERRPRTSTERSATHRQRKRDENATQNVADATQNVADGGNHIGGGPTYPPSSGGEATSSLTSSPPVVVTPLPTLPVVPPEVPPSRQPDPDWLLFRETYPKTDRTSWSKAEVRFKALRLPDRVAALEGCKTLAGQNRPPEFRQGAQTWLNERRWETVNDWHPPSANGNGHLSPAQAIFEDFKRRRDGQDNFIEGEVIRR